MKELKDFIGEAARYVVVVTNQEKGVYNKDGVDQYFDPYDGALFQNKEDALNSDILTFGSKAKAENFLKNEPLAADIIARGYKIEKV